MYLHYKYYCRLTCCVKKKYKKKVGLYISYLNARYRVCAIGSFVVYCWIGSLYISGMCQGSFQNHVLNAIVFYARVYI